MPDMTLKETMLEEESDSGLFTNSGLL